TRNRRRRLKSFPAANFPRGRWPFRSAARELAQCPEPPGQFPTRGNLQKRDARRCAAIRPGDAARIEESNTAQDFISRHMSVTVKHDVHVLQRIVRRNVNESKPNSISI